MIQLTRLNNQLLVVNSDLIKFVEKSPDTVLTLVTGEKIVVRETTDDVLDRIDEIVAPGTTVNPVDNSFSNPALAPAARRRSH